MNILLEKFKAFRTLEPKYVGKLGKELLYLVFFLGGGKLQCKKMGVTKVFFIEQEAH